jgi:hypothetical protein
MTDTTTTEVPESTLDTSPGNTSPDAGLRHSIQYLLRLASGCLRGEPGLSQEQQIERVTKAMLAAETAVADLGTLKTLVTNRDFEKFQATRDRSAEQEADKPTGGVIGFLVVAMGDSSDDSDDDDTDESTSDYTQD